MNKLKQALMFLVLFLFLVNAIAYAQISSKEIDQLVEKAAEKFNVAGDNVLLVTNYMNG